MAPNTVLRPYGTAGIANAAALIRSGQPVAIPTETVYGLAADATNGEAVARIYAAKGRPAFNPLIVHVLDLAAAERLAIFDDQARTLAAAHWPGPLTLVLPRRADNGIASLVTAGLNTIAIRVPAHRAMRALLSASGKPLAAPSANASGTISPTRADHVLRTLDGRIAMIIDDGACPVGLESTIVACDADGLRLLRAGPVIIETAVANESRAIEAPGQLDRHYAPSKPLRLNALEAKEDEWLIGFGAVAGNATLSASGDLIEAAAALFDCLHRADSASALRIAVAPVPATGVGVAINDRLGRAARHD
jgi:L-threonylcarbamoyladenylate synthase